MRNDSVHWWRQRVSSLLMLPFAFFAIFVFLQTFIPSEEYQLSFFSAFCVTIFISVSLYHGTLGMRVIFEDYISSLAIRYVLIIFCDILSFITSFAFIFCVLSAV